MAVVANRALPQGYKLHNYRIDRAISRGGFSIVYRAVDDNGTVVAIKEYLPSGLVLRSEGSRVHASSIENLDSFRFGMKCFFDEGKSLATINHPNVVRVLNFFRANETVYMVMKYERGRTLQQYIQGNQGMLPEGLIRHVFSRLLNGLREVHSRRLLHLDIKPANIYIRTDGSPVLLDFGAARQVLASRGSRMTPMYTPGFAAPEQYNNTRRELLGPWTDIYSVGASIYACMAAAAPQAADQRLERDQLAPALKRWPDKYSRQLLETVDWCMRMNYLERPQSVFALQKSLADKQRSVPKPTFLSDLRKRVRDLIK